MSEPKLTRRERERIIFQYLKGQPDPLYDVQETNHGKYVVTPKQIEVEEESVDEEPKTKDQRPETKDQGLQHFTSSQ